MFMNFPLLVSRRRWEETPEAYPQGSCQMLSAAFYAASWAANQGPCRFFQQPVTQRAEGTIFA